MKGFDKLSEKAKAVLTTLCSNYRESMQIEAEFKCRAAYGIEKFIKEITKYLKELKRRRFIVDFRLSEYEEVKEICYFSVQADMDMSVEDMAEAAINSQTVYRQD